MISYQLERDLEPAEFIGLLERSGLAERRPVDEQERVAKMLEHGNLVVAARDGSGLLVGVARSLTDFSFCCYLSDLAVDQSFQGRGIGRELIRRTREAAGPGATLILLSAPGAMSFYAHIGLERFDNCFGIRARS